ncbi:MAG: hypothetical protein ACKOAH_22050, partial [Pirellula sp.]
MEEWFEQLPILNLCRVDQGPNLESNNRILSVLRNGDRIPSPTNAYEERPCHMLAYNAWLSLL